MKIAFFGSDKNTDIFRVGGIESILRRLIGFLLENGHEIYVFVMSSHRLEKQIEFTNGRLTLFYDETQNLRRKLLNSDFQVINFLSTPFSNIYFLIKLLLKKKK